MKDRKKGKLGSKVFFIMLIMFIIAMLSTMFTIVGMNFNNEVKEKRNNISYYAQLVSCVVESPDYDYSVIQKENAKKYAQADTPASSFNGAECVDDWLQYGPDEGYVKVYYNLNNLVSSLEVSDIFVIKPVKDEKGNVKNEALIIFDTSYSSSPDSIDSPGGYYENQFSATAVNEVYKTGKPQVAKIKEYATVETEFDAYAPVVDGSGKTVAIAGVKVTFKSILMSVLKDNWFLFIDDAFDFIILALALAFFIRKSIIKPVNRLSGHMRNFVSDENALTYKPVNDIKTNDELEQMGDDFNALAERVIFYTKNLEEKTAEQERIKTDLKVASEIRNIISGDTSYPAFPDRTDFDLCLSMNHTLYNKCSFCKYFFVDTNKLYVVMGEALGDSLASVIFSALSMSYIKSTAMMGLEPYRVAAEVNNNLCSIEKKDKGLTIGAIIAEIDLTNGVMRYVNAGMPPVLIKKPGEKFALDSARQSYSLGQMHGVTFGQNSLNLSQGTTVLFSSFGVSEMHNSKGMEYSMQRLLNNVNSITSGVYELDRIIESINKDLEDFRQDAPLTKDTTLLGFRYFG